MISTISNFKIILSLGPLKVPPESRRMYDIRFLDADYPVAKISI